MYRATLAEVRVFPVSHGVSFTVMLLHMRNPELIKLEKRQLWVGQEDASVCLTWCWTTPRCAWMTPRASRGHSEEPFRVTFLS